MTIPSLRCPRRAALAIALATALPAWADIGQIKTRKGEVTVQRQGQLLPAEVGMRLEVADTLRTGADGAVGITMRDNSLLSAGPNSIVSLQRFEFDAGSGQGRFDTQLQRGTLAVASGRIARQSPPSMTVRTPAAQLAVRGTEFVVEAGE
jgi:hypothetical protein